MEIKDKLNLVNLKSTAKNLIYVTLRLSSNMIGTDGINFQHNLRLTSRHALGLCMPFANSSLKGENYPNLRYSK